jgi:hypothetical protein
LFLATVISGLLEVPGRWMWRKKKRTHEACFCGVGKNRARNKYPLLCLNIRNYYSLHFTGNENLHKHTWHKNRWDQPGACGSCL